MSGASVARWIRRLFGRPRLERDLDRELQFHVDEDTRRLVATGLAPVDARRIALAAFGGIDPIKEQARDARGTRWVEALLQDARYAVRMMRRSPAFTAAAALSLAIGVGANAAIFSVTDALVFRPLPIDEPDHVWFVSRTAAGGGSLDFSAASFEALRAVPGARVAAMSSAIRVQTAIGPETASTAIEQLTSGDWFDVLGVLPAAGRLLRPADAPAPGASAVGVLSYAYWTRIFARNPAIVGSTIRVNGVPIQIVGVAAEGFEGVTVGERIDLWLPITLQQNVRFNGNATISNADGEKPWMLQDGVLWLQILARLPPGTRGAVGAQFAAVDRQQLEGLVADLRGPERRQSFLQFHVELQPAGRGRSPLRDVFASALGVLMVTVALVLLIACANLASLLLARGAGRSREFALRLALGAGRGRLARQLLTESLVVAGLGGALGLVVARLGGRALLRLASSGAAPIPLTLPFDGRFVGFTAAVSLATGLIFGLVPALRFSRVDLAQALEGGARTIGDGAGARILPIGRTLVILQMALSLGLLVFAMLFVQTFRNLLTFDAGYEREHTVTARFNPRLAGFTPDQLPALHARLLGHARAIPGVRSASLAFGGPVTGMQRTSDVTIEGRPRLSANQNLREDYVGPDYFATIGMPFVEGRDFLPSDTLTAPKVAIVNEAMARHFFGHDEALGRRYGYGTPADITIIGIVRDARVDGLRQSAPPMAFYPFDQHPTEMALNLYVRVEGPVEPVRAALAGAVTAADRNLAVREVATVADLAERTVVRERLVSELTAAFGLLAVIVACLGLYGTVSFAVARRRTEIGVRLALGATPSHVRWLVLRETLWLVGVGGVLGCLAVQVALRYVATLLYGLSPHDPATLVAALTVLAIVGLAAGAVPAWRASRVDPLTALRAD